MNVVLRAIVAAALPILSAGAAAAQDIVLGQRSYPTVDEAIANLPPVPTWCEEATGGETCVPVTQPSDGPTSLVWRPGWAMLDQTYCADEGTANWRVSCEASDAVRVIAVPPPCAIYPGEPPQCPPPRFPSWREGEAQD